MQPIGAVALVVTTLATARMTRRSPGRRALTSVAYVSEGWARSLLSLRCSPRTFGSVTGTSSLAWLFSVSSSPHSERVTVSGGGDGGAVIFTSGADILFGFVAALAKTVIARLFQGDFEWLTLTCLAGLVIAALSGTFPVQNAHTRGTPELVVAGLTVIDPLVAVTIVITILGEADNAPPQAFIAYLLAGAIAVTGVIQLATVNTAHTLPARE